MTGIPEVLGTIPGWITSATVVSGMGIYLKNMVDGRKLSIEDREALRSGYAAQVTALTQDNIGLRAEMVRIRREADADREDCYKVTDALRTIVTQLREELAGMRMNAMAKDAAAIRSTDAISPAMQRALDTIDQVTGTRGPATETGK